MSKKPARIQGGPGLPYNWVSRERRRERQEKNAELLAGFLETPPNRATRKRLRKAKIKRNYSPAQVKRSYKDKDTLRRLVAFYGPKRILGKRESLYRLEANGKWLQDLTPKESRRVNKYLRRKRHEGAA